MSDRTWAEATTSKSAAEVRGDLLAACVEQGCTVSGWPSVAPQRALVEGNASALAYETELRAALAKLASPPTAEDAGDTWVDAGVSWYDLDNGVGGKGRIPASVAVWNVPLVVAAAAAPLVIDASSAIQAQADDGTIFVSAPSNLLILNATTSYRAVVRFVARKPGTTGNVIAGQITRIISGPAGLSVDDAESQVLVTAARDQETSAEYIRRGLGRWGTLGAGWTLPSFDYLIPKFAPTVTRWTVRDDNPLGPGTIKVTVANAAGTATAGEISAVKAGLDAHNVRSLGSGKLVVVGATPHPLTLAAALDTDGSNPTVLAQAGAALLALARAFPLGIATLTVDVVRAVLMGAPVETITIPVGSGSQILELNLPGFSSVERIASLSLGADVMIGDAEVLALTPALTEV